MTQFETTAEPAPGRVPGEELDIDGWRCEPIIFAKMGFEPDTYTSWCEDGDRAIATIDASTDLPSDGPIVKPGEGRRTVGTGDREGQWGFVSPSGTWSCAIIDNPSPDRGGLRTGVECEGHKDIPRTSVQADGGGMMAANGVQMLEGSAPEPISVNEKLVDPQETFETLEDGEILYAGGAACTVSAEQGVTCTQDGHRFTVSFVHGFEGR